MKSALLEDGSPDWEGIRSKIDAEDEGDRHTTVTGYDWRPPLPLLQIAEMASSLKRLIRMSLYSSIIAMVNLQKSKSRPKWALI